MGTADPAELAVRVESAVKSLAKAGTMLAKATGVLKEVKNPMKLKSAKRSVDYAQGVSTAASEELAYQGRLVASLLSGE